MNLQRHRHPLLTSLLLLGVSVSLVEAQLSQTNTFTSVNKVIPDGNAAGVHDVRTIFSPIAFISSVRVRLSISGNFNGDLYGYVRHGTGFTVLLNRSGRTASNTAGYSDSGFDVVFSDSVNTNDIHNYRSVTNLGSGSPLTGAWQPDARDLDPDLVTDASTRSAFLSALTNLNANGDWTLFLADMYFGGTNLLNGWAIEIQGTGRLMPQLTWTNPASMSYGTALSATQLNATSSVPGSFVYSPPLGTVLNASNGQTLSVTFTPIDTNTYFAVTTNVSLNVFKAPLTVTAADKNKIYGSTNPPLTANYSGYVNGDNSSVLSGSPALSTAATTLSEVGTYLISPSAGTLAASNYTFIYSNGLLTVTTAASIGAVSSSANPQLPGQQVTFSFTMSAVAPGALTPGGLVQFRIDGAPAGGLVSLTNGVATLTSASLSVGEHDIIAEYPGDANYRGATNSLSPRQIINTPPVGVADVMERNPTQGTKVSIAILLSNDSDSDGDPLTFMGISPNSTAGGTLVISNGWVFYTPPVGFTNADSVTYSISDGRGGTATALITVNVQVDTGASGNLTITAQPDGSVRLSFSGIPGRTYTIQYALSIASPNWELLGTRTADAVGRFEYVDSPSSSRFYRTIYP